ncbi:MAG: CoA-binding protein [Porticoccaceae bacterium]|jgi:predicted CoA-binding protein
MTSTVAILGASSNPDRYAWLAQKMLSERGYKVLPVSLKEKEIGGLPTLASINDIREPVDTLTLYLSPDKVEACAKDIVALKPRRVIFNPGTESLEAMRQLENNGIEVEQACTLVMLRTGQFD